MFNDENITKCKFWSIYNIYAFVKSKGMILPGDWPYKKAGALLCAKPGHVHHTMILSISAFCSVLVWVR